MMKTLNPDTKTDYIESKIYKYVKKKIHKDSSWISSERKETGWSLLYLNEIRDQVSPIKLE